jgi:hypothetical protein
MKFNKYWLIAKRLQTEQLQRLNLSQLDFSEKSLFNLDLGRRGSTFFLGYYSEEGIRLALQKYGVYKKLKQRGFEDVVTFVDTSDPYRHKITLYHHQQHQNNIIVELVLRKDFFSIKMPFAHTVAEKTYLGLTIDWLCVQNLLGSFSEDRQQLPGQKYPGLGFSSVVVELLMLICWRLNLAGLINIPEFYHNAVFYSKIFYYLDPLDQAKFLALQKTFKKFKLSTISWGIDWGCVRDLQTNQPFTWFVKQQIVPLEKDLKCLFKSKEYQDCVHQAVPSFRFAFDEDLYNKMKKINSAKKSEEEHEN